MTCCVGLGESISAGTAAWMACRSMSSSVRRMKSLDVSITICRVGRGTAKGRTSSCCVSQLGYGQFGDECDSLAALHHAHERLHAAQVVDHLAGLCGFQLAEADELVAEAVPLV